MVKLVSDRGRSHAGSAGAQSSRVVAARRKETHDVVFHTAEFLHARGVELRRVAIGDVLCIDTADRVTTGS